MRARRVRELSDNLKDAIAMEIYSIIHRRISLYPLLAYLRRGKKYLVIRFEEGLIEDMKIMGKEVNQKDTVSIPVPKEGEFMKELYKSIREKLEDADVSVDYEYWYALANSDRWVFV